MAQINDKNNIKQQQQRIEVSDGALIPEKGETSIFSAWTITFTGAIIIIVLLPILKPKPYWEIYKFLPDGIFTTFEVTVLSILISLVIGVFVGLGRISRIVLINRISTIYVEVIRGIPLLVQLFYIYFVLSAFFNNVFGFALSGVPSAVIAMSICYGAYIGEIFRAGIISIPRGQMEAAISLGMTRGQALWKIILPQTVKVVLPPIGNEFIAMLKDSSLVSMISVADLLRRGKEYAGATFSYFETFTVIALVYLILTLFFSRIVGITEERMRRRGRK
jgi:polar amino acid transport system permease protein